MYKNKKYKKTPKSNKRKSLFCFDIENKKQTLNFYCILHNNDQDICNIYECVGIRINGDENSHMPYIT